MAVESGSSMTVITVKKENWSLTMWVNDQFYINEGKWSMK